MNRIKSGPSAPARPPQAASWWLRVPLGVLLALMTTFVLARNGIGADALARPFADEFLGSFPHLPPWPALYHYLFSSPLGVAVANVLQISSYRGFVALHVVVLVGGMVGLVVMARRAYGDLAARLLVTTFAASQVPSMLLGRIGGYDPWTIVLGGAMALTASVPVGLIVGVLLAWTAFEQASVALAGLFVIRTLLGESRRSLVAAGAGLLVGRLLLQLWLNWAGAEGTRLTWIRHFGVSMFVEMFLQGLVLLLLTMTGGVFVLAIQHARSVAADRRWRVGGAWLVACLVPLLPVILSDDESRVYACIWWPMAAYLAITMAKEVDRAVVTRAAVWALGAAVVVPGILVSHGKPSLADHHLWRLFF